MYKLLCKKYNLNNYMTAKTKTNSKYPLFLNNITYYSTQYSNLVLTSFDNDDSILSKKKYENEFKKSKLFFKEYVTKMKNTQIIG